MTTMKNIQILDLSPQIDALWPELTRAIEGVLKSGAFIMGPDVKAFEDEAAQYLGSKHAISCNSGTDALVLGLRALGIGAGDQVITTPFSFFATAESISMVGATPVFVDIDPLSYNINANLLEAAITPKTKAIMPVHLYGNPAAMDNIMAVAQKHNLKVIEDCAQSWGAKFRFADGRVKHTGTIGDVGAYSFFPSKNLGAYGDGGLIATDDDTVAAKCRMLRVHGSAKKYHNEVLGYNSRLDSIQAAILRVKLPHIDKWNNARRAVAAYYNEQLAQLAGVVTPTITAGHVFHQYTIRITNNNRDHVQAALQKAGVQTMIYYPIPQDQLPVYGGKPGRFVQSDRAAREVLSLPIWPELTRDVQDHVVAALAAALA